MSIRSKPPTSIARCLAFVNVLQHPKYDPLPLAQELYQILLGPVAKDLEKAKAQTLMWSLGRCAALCAVVSFARWQAVSG